jgi:hypothetical protein
MKAYMGDLDHGTSLKWVVSFTPRSLYPPGKEPMVPIWYEAGRDPAPVWTIWREDPYPYWDLNFGPLIIQPLDSRYTDCTNPTPAKHTSK